MKCPHCNTFVSKIPVNWKCPHCGEQLPPPGFWFRFFEGLTDYLIEKGAVFWSVTLGLVILLLAGMDMAFGDSILMTYIGSNFLLSVVMVIFGGMLIDMYMRVVLPLRIPFGSDFLLKERKQIRNARKLTHIGGIVGLLVCLFWLGPYQFIMYFPSYIVVIGWFLAITWSIMGIFFDPRMLEDVRFRYYMDRLEVTSLRKLRKSGTICIAALFLTGVTFFLMSGVPDLPRKLLNTAIIGNVILFAKIYLSWII